MASFFLINSIPITGDRQLLISADKVKSLFFEATQVLLNTVCSMKVDTLTRPFRHHVIRDLFVGCTDENYQHGQLCESSNLQLILLSL